MKARHNETATYSYYKFLSELQEYKRLSWSDFIGGKTLFALTTEGLLQYTVATSPYTSFPQIIKE